MRLILLALAAVLMAVATIVYLRRPQPEPDDWRCTRCRATRLYPGPA